MKLQLMDAIQSKLSWTVLIIYCCCYCNLAHAVSPATEPTSIPGIDKFARVSDGLYRGAQPTADGFAAVVIEVTRLAVARS